MATVINPGTRPNRTRWIILAVVGGLVALVLLMVAAFAGLVFLGGSMFHDQAQAAMQRQPEIAEHVGTIESITLGVDATGMATGTDVFVFDIVGDKGRGTVVAEFITVDSTKEALGRGELRLEDGRKIEFSGPQAQVEVA